MVLLLLGLSLPQASAFFGDEYLRRCGGEIYPACDGPQINQMSIFEAARAEARRQKKGLLVILGADWCKPCRELSQEFTKDVKGRALLEKRFVLVKLAASVEERGPAEDRNKRPGSIAKVARAMGITIDSFPTAYVVNPTTGKATDTFLVGGVKPTEINDLAFEAPK